MANEKRFIEANALKALFDERYDDVFVQERTRLNTQFWNGHCCGLNWGRNTIEDAPTVDAVEVVHGRWEMTLYTTTSKRGRVIGNKKFACSECGYSNGRKKSNYCPNCGADMRERKDNG